jgi:hypothetical protein
MSVSGREKRAVANALVVLMTLARHSLSRAQTQMATRSVEELLWVLGLPEYQSEGRTYTARPPSGAVLDLAATPLLKGER